MAFASSFSSAALSAAALGVHDAVQPEVQVGLVELEQLLKQGLQPFKLLTHPVYFRATSRHGATTRWAAARAAGAAA